METDHVIAGTGYKVDVGLLAFLDPALRSQSKAVHEAPALDSLFQSSVRDLHFVGISSAFAFGPVMRFVHGTKHGAILAGHLCGAAPMRPAQRHDGSEVVAPVLARSSATSMARRPPN
jgi:hypothetical protein